MRVIIFFIILSTAISAHAATSMPLSTECRSGGAFVNNYYQQTAIAQSEADAITIRTNQISAFVSNHANTAIRTGSHYWTCDYDLGSTQWSYKYWYDENRDGSLPDGFIHGILYPTDGIFPEPEEPPAADWDSDGLPDTCDPTPQDATPFTFSLITTQGDTYDPPFTSATIRIKGGIYELGDFDPSRRLFGHVGSEMDQQTYADMFCGGGIPAGTSRASTPAMIKAEGVAGALEEVSQQEKAWNDKVTEISGELSANLTNESIKSRYQTAQGIQSNLQAELSKLKGELVSAVADALKEDEESGEPLTYNPSPTGGAYSMEGEFEFGSRLGSFMSDIKTSQLFSLPSDVLGTIPTGGESVMSFDGGTFGEQSFDLSDFSAQLAIIKAVFLIGFSFAAIRIVILKG